VASSVDTFRHEFVVPPPHDPANALADLLGALSTIDKLAPLEGRQREKRGDAYVVFQYGSSNGELREFVGQMIPRLHELAPAVTFAIDLEWVAGSQELLAILNVPAGSAGALSSAIEATAADGWKVRGAARRSRKEATHLNTDRGTD
jgi:hypothetical protein